MEPYLRSAGRIHVNVQLIDTRNNSPLWAEKYDRDMNDVFTLQSEIAQKVADQLGANLHSPKKLPFKSGQPRILSRTMPLVSQTVNRQCFLHLATEGRFGAGNPTTRTQAAGRDALFYHAYCELTEAHDRNYFLGFDHTDRRLQLAETTLESIRRLRPGSGEMHLAVAKHLYWAYGDH